MKDLNMNRKQRFSFLIFSTCALLLLCAYSEKKTEGRIGPAGSLNHVLTDPWYDSIFGSRDFSNLVVSITADEEDLYSEERGILTPSLSFQGRDGERPVKLFVYDAEGTPMIAQNAGIRLSGATSREAIRKSFRLVARKEYDKGNPRFTCDLWNGRQTLDGTGAGIESYQSFILHSMRLAMDSTGIHNSVGYSLARKAGILDAAPTTPAAVYLNGDYQGAYFIIPAKNDHALSELYRIEHPEDIEVVSVFEEEKTGIQTAPEVLEEYLAFVSYVYSCDMNDSAAIAEIERQLDVNQCLEYYAVNLLMGNGDWIDNNLRVWRCKNNGLPFQDGKWRFFLFDLDWIGSFPDLVSVTFQQAVTSTDSYNILPRLLENPDYLEQFRQIIDRMEKDAFNPETIEAVFAEEDARMREEAAYDIQSDAFFSYMHYSHNSTIIPEDEYLTLEDRQYLVEDFKSHMLKAPGIIDSCMEAAFPL